jgi:Flp pilus assembly protein CpaB
VPRNRSLFVARLRLHRHGVLWWLAAAALAVSTAAWILSLSNRAEATLAAYGRRTTVVVATRSMDAGHVVRAGDVRRRSQPAGLVPPGALREPPIGRTVAAAIVEGEVVVRERVAPAGRSGIAALLPPGTRAVAVPVDQKGLRLQVGDVVDVLATFDPDAAAPSGDPTFAVAERAVVVDVDDGAVTVAVGADEAPRVAFALAQGVVTLALVGG